MRRTKTKQPVSRRRREPHYEFLYEDDSQPITLDARSLTLPSVAIISLVFAFMWGTYIIIGERNRLDTRINNVLTSVEKLTSAVTVLAEQVNDEALDRRARYKIPKTTIEGLRQLENATRQERLKQEEPN